MFSYTNTNTVTYTLPTEIADNIVIQHLQSIASDLIKQIDCLRSKDDLTTQDLEDLANAFSYRDAFIKVLEYITPPHSHKEWLRNNDT